VQQAGSPGAAEAAGAAALTERPLRPVPRPSVRPWAGDRLGEAGTHVGELWLAGPDSVVADRAGGRVTLDQLAASGGEAFVGARAMHLLGPRFPLLVKVIDAADWLSLQVHPSDTLAAELLGPDALGKTEAWVVLDAAPDAVLVTGPRRDLTETKLRRAIRRGEMDRSHCETRPAVPGEALLLPAGTVHAIGAGAFVYEIEQPSDITFRISDWGRPASTERPLHVAEALRSVRPESHALPVGHEWRLEGGALAMREFQLEIVDLGTEHARDPGGRSVEVLTAIRGTAEVSGDGWYERLEPYETLVIPASIAGYRVAGPPGGLAFVGSIP
jgi:mannose-6-phosphate isomerase